MSSSRRFARFIAAALVGLGVLAAPAVAWAGTAPTVVGSVSNGTTLASVVSVAVSGTTAYTTAAQAAQLTAVDVSNPASPSILGSTASTPTLQSGSNVAIAGHYAFAVAKNRNASTTSNDDGSGNALTIVDISNPAAPSLVGSVRSATELFGSYGVAVSGNYAFVAYQGLLSGQPTGPDTSSGGFSVIDITNPAGPSIVANIDNPPSGQWFNAFKHSTSVQISGHYAFVTAFYDQRITVVDISSPTSPHIVASLRDATNLGAPADLAIQGSDLYVANQTNGVTSPEFTVIDISNPLAPSVLSTVSNSMLAGAYRIRVRGDFAYVSGFNSSAVSAVDISDPTHPRFAGAVQDAAHLHRTTGLDLDPTGRYVIASSPNLSTDSTSNYPPFPVAHGTISVIDMVPNPIAVTIAPASEPPNPTTQATATFTFATNDDVSAVACSLDGAAPGPCTSPTSQSYTGLAAGSHTFTVQATDSSGHTASASYTWAVQQAPANTTAPSVSGSASLGQTLTASPGSWSGYPAPTFTYAWERCDQTGSACSAIGGATSQAYTATRADVGNTLVVVVTATNPQGSVPMASGATAIVTGAPQNSSAPSVAGTASLGQTLTASAGSWSGYPAPSFTYAWERCDQTGSACSAIGGATSPSYTATRADVGSTLVALVTGTNGLGSSQTPSAASPIVTGPPQNTSLPSISGYSGAPAPGVTLTASPGAWSAYPAASFSYVWQRCTAASGCSTVATAQTYTPSSADTGSTLDVVVTAGNGQAPAGQATSAATPAVTGAPQNTAPPTVTGTAAQGQTLTASPGAWTGSPAPSFTYAWQRCAPGSGCTAISNATSQTYTTTRADVGATLDVVVTGTNSQGASSATSGSTAFVTGAPQSSAPPTASGTALQGQTLTASPGVWSGYPAPTFTYAWQRCAQNGTGCGLISGATGQTYTLTRADVAATIAVTVTGSSSSGSAQATSATTAIVNGPPSATAPPVITGRALVGNTLTATQGTWTGYPTPTLTDQWQRCSTTGENCQAIAGATTTSYTVTSADVGVTIRFLVHGVNSAGSALGRSAQTAIVATSGSGAVRGLGSRRPSLRITAFAPRPGSALTKLTITLPKGLSFGRLGSRLHVADANGRRLAFTAKVVHGALTITLKSPATAVAVVIDPGAISETRQLASAAKAKRQKHLGLTLTLTGTHGLSVRAPLSAGVSS